MYDIFNNEQWSEINKLIAIGDLLYKRYEIYVIYDSIMQLSNIQVNFYESICITVKCPAEELSFDVLFVHVW